jgi:hypothetical protein
MRRTSSHSDSDQPGLRLRPLKPGQARGPQRLVPRGGCALCGAPGRRRPSAGSRRAASTEAEGQCIGCGQACGFMDGEAW